MFNSPVDVCPHLEFSTQLLPSLVMCLLLVILLFVYHYCIFCLSHLFVYIVFVKRDCWCAFTFGILESTVPKSFVGKPLLAELLPALIELKVSGKYTNTKSLKENTPIQKYKKNTKYQVLRWKTSASAFDWIQNKKEVNSFKKIRKNTKLTFVGSKSENFRIKSKFIIWNILTLLLPNI